MKTPAFTTTLRALFAVAALSPLAAFSQTIYLDFGANATTTAGWNNQSNKSVSSVISLVDFDTQLASGISYQITDDFQDPNTQVFLDAVGEFPATAGSDFFYGSNTNPTAQIVFTGFDPAKQYTFTFLSTRTGASDNRSTLFTLTGSSVNSAVVNSAISVSPVPGSILSASPSVSGSFTLDVAKDAANNNGSGFYYLNALKIEVSTIPEPSTYAALLGFGALGLCLARRRR